MYGNNEDLQKFATMLTIYTRTKRNALPYHLFWSKVKAIEIGILAINTNDKL